MRSTAQSRIRAVRQVPGHDVHLLADVADWVQERLVLFPVEKPALVHGELHGSDVIVVQGPVTGLIDFAEALAQPADIELDTTLRWCARAREFVPTPGEPGLDETTLTPVPSRLHGAYPEFFERENLRERLNFTTCTEKSRSTRTIRLPTTVKPPMTASSVCSPAITISIDWSGEVPSASTALLPVE